MTSFSVLRIYAFFSSSNISAHTANPISSGVSAPMSIPMGHLAELNHYSLTPRLIAAFLKAFHFDVEPIAPILGLICSPLILRDLNKSS